MGQISSLYYFQSLQKLSMQFTVSRQDDSFGLLQMDTLYMFLVAS